MIAHHTEVEPHAVEAPAKLDKPILRRIQSTIDKPADDPRPTGVVAVETPPGCLRLRVGDYRVLREAQDRRLVVLVVDLGCRREVYER